MMAIGYIILRKGNKYLKVSTLGKVATFVLMISIAILLLRLPPYDIY
ncbi:unnamed protein product, partial [marine sediment metagenome]